MLITGAVMAANRPAPPEAPLTLETVRKAFPHAEELVAPADQKREWIPVLGPAGEHLGAIAVTSPYSDDVIGYAGPTPLLIAVNPDGVIESVVLLNNRETPEYVRQIIDAGFMRQWTGSSWREVAHEPLKVDAVSGATITSVAIAETLGQRLSLMDPDAPVRPPPSFIQRIGPIDIAVLAVAALGFALGLLHGRTPRWARQAQLGLSFLVLGVIAASMLSMALLGGWVTNWNLTGPPSLAIVAGAAISSSVVLRKNFYCHFICPFGALQELLFRAIPFKVKIGRGWHRGLRYVRYFVLTFAGFSLILGLGVDLNDLEPFSAFRPRLAGLAALLIGAAALVLSPALHRPWCNYGCGTGALLDTLRRPPIKKV